MTYTFDFLCTDRTIFLRKFRLRRKFSNFFLNLLKILKLCNRASYNMQYKMKILYYNVSIWTWGRWAAYVTRDLPYMESGGLRFICFISFYLFIIYFRAFVSCSLFIHLFIILIFRFNRRSVCSESNGRPPLLNMNSYRGRATVRFST